MGELTKHMRDAMPAKDFAGPDRSFPVENKSHARAAEMDAKISEEKGHISKAEDKRIDAKARRELHKK